MAYAEALLGEPARARALLEESQELSGDARHAADLEHPIVLILAMATKSAGDPEGARALFEESLALGRADGDIHTTLASLRHVGTLALQRGELKLAGRLFAESLGLAWELVDYSCIRNGLGGLALTAIEVGQSKRATQLLGMLDRLSELAGHRTVLSAADSSTATLRVRLGEEAFAEAWAQGRAMTLEEAIEAALGVSELLPDASGDAGETATASQGSLLTGREREVAELIARGYANRQIAAELVISERTVHAHVRHILDKLGFGSRAQVAAWAAREGWLAASTR
jgi:non-specific serine/threonine protein kinase